MYQKNFVLVAVLLFTLILINYSESLNQCIGLEKIMPTETHTTKYCRYQTNIYPASIFKLVSGHGCHSYGPATRFKEVVHYYKCLFTYSDNRTYTIRYSIHMQDNKTRVYYYDYTDPDASKFIADTFQDEKYFNKWKQCAQVAFKCCENEMTNENIIGDSETCPVVWDAWTCYLKTNANSTAEEYCPSYIYMSDAPCRQKSRKDCLNGGSWNDKTDYGTCQFLRNVRARHIYHVCMLGIAIFICVPAIIIYFIYPSLRILRVALHRNLLIAIVIKNIFVMMSKMLITVNAMDEDDSVLKSNTVACRVLAFFERAAINAVYASMLVDGIYLHKLIVTVFRKDPKIHILYIVVCAFSLVPTFIWAALKGTQDNVYCWVVDESWRQWILDSSRYAMLGINFLLLMDIIRVLIWKLKRNTTTEHAKYCYISIKGSQSYNYVFMRAFLTTLRATLILLPLFGIQFIMMSQRPVNAPCVWDDVFYYISYTMDASQGIMVSILYCYINKEVQTLLQQSYRNIKLRYFNKSSDDGFSKNRRRTTAATYVPENSLPEF